MQYFSDLAARTRSNCSLFGTALSDNLRSPFWNEPTQAHASETTRRSIDDRDRPAGPPDS